MAKERVRFSEALGKTIAGAEFSFTIQQMVIAFTDGTYAVVGMKRGYEVGDEELIDEELAWSDFGDEKLAALGILSEQEMREKRKAKHEKWERNREKADREAYRQLKKRFGRTTK